MDIPPNGETGQSGVPPSAQQPDQPTTPAARPSQRLPVLNNAQIILLVMVAVGGSLVLNFGQRIAQGQEKAEELRQLEAEIEALRQEQWALESAKAYYSSEAFVEAWAHDQGKMVREGEVLVIPLYSELAQGSEEGGAASSPAAMTEKPLAPWRVWWSLFFDSPPPFSQE